MSNRRYMIVEHPRSAARLSIVNGQVVGQIPIHHLLFEYHWHRLDETHVLLVGTHSLSTRAALVSHPKVTVLPHQTSMKNLKAHCVAVGKNRHFDSLASALQLDETASMGHFLDAIEDKLGPVFLPEK